MISAQIDELRKWADQLSERENEFGVVVRALVAALRNAADTIWQLRDDLQRANNAVQEAEHDESMAWDRVRKADADNTKLRELVAEALRELDAATQYDAGGGRGVVHELAEQARELGIEVDG